MRIGRRQHYLFEEGAASVLPHEGIFGPEHPLAAEVHVYPETADARYDVHSGFELGVALHGEQVRIFSDIVLPISPGDVWLVCAWELHGWRCPSSDMTVIPLVFLPEFLGEETLAGTPWVSLFAAPPGRRPRVRTEQLRTQVLAIAADLREEIEATPPGWEEAVRLHVLRLLLALRREWEPPQTGFPTSPIPTTQLMRIMPALEALHTDPVHHLSLGEAAARCGLSASRFAALFRRIMGMSFGRFSLNARMAQVAHRLIATDQSIEAIAARLGFTDDSHLHRSFVGHYHLTPAAYRREMR